MFRKVRGSAVRAWIRPLLLLVLATGGLLVFYLWQLGTLTEGFSPAEKAAISSSASLNGILDAPVNAPHKLVQYGLAQLSSQSWAARLPSVLFMLVFLASMYVVLRLWFGRWVAFTGTLLFAATPPLIILARSAVPSILLLAPLLMIACTLWLSRRTSYRSAVWLLLCASVALSLYVPGMLWFMIVVAAFKYRSLIQLSQPINNWVLAGGAVAALLLLVPLAYGAITSPHIIKELLVIPDAWRSPLATIKSVVWSALSLLWRQPYPTDFTIGRLPLLSLAQLALAAFGIYALWSKARSVVYWLAAILAASVLVAGVNEKPIMLLPALIAAALLTAAGLRYLFVEWNSIFPKNPIPRSLALVLMIAVVGVHTAYGLRYVLVAWPNTPAVEQSYVLK